jgi:Spy/CpxP family protein refolding chaperone
VQAKIDSIHDQFRAQSRTVFTPDQLKRLEEHKKEAHARRQAREAKEPKKQCSIN